MIHSNRDFLPADLYRFFDYEISVRSNSPEALEHLRFVYNRFYAGCDKDLSDGEGAHGSTQKFCIQITDNLHDANEFLIENQFYFYRLSRNNDSFTYTFQDLHSKTNSTKGISDPLVLTSTAVFHIICRVANNHNLIHAGAVSLNGEGLFFPALPKMGKTTLVLALVQRGFSFLSDEIACLHSDKNQLDPFPRAINVRDESRKILGIAVNHEPVMSFDLPWELIHTFDIEYFAEDSLSPPCKPRYLIFLKGFGEKSRLEYVSNSNALFELPKFIVSPIPDPGHLLLKLASVIEKLHCFNLVIGDLDETAELIMNLANGKYGERRIFSS